MGRRKADLVKRERALLELGEEELLERRACRSLQQPRHLVCRGWRGLNRCHQGIDVVLRLRLAAAALALAFALRLAVGLRRLARAAGRVLGSPLVEAHGGRERLALTNGNLLGGAWDQELPTSVRAGERGRTDCTEFMSPAFLLASARSFTGHHALAPGLPT